MQLTKTEHRFVSWFAIVVTIVFGPIFVPYLAFKQISYNRSKRRQRDQFFEAVRTYNCINDCAHCLKGAVYISEKAKIITGIEAVRGNLWIAAKEREAARVRCSDISAMIGVVHQSLADAVGAEMSSRNARNN